jgi:hypothetical protein
MRRSLLGDRRALKRAKIFTSHNGNIADGYFIEKVSATTTCETPSPPLRKCTDAVVDLFRSQYDTGKGET